MSSYITSPTGYGFSPRIRTRSEMRVMLIRITLIFNIFSDHLSTILPFVKRQSRKWGKRHNLESEDGKRSVPSDIEESLSAE
jgi:hypothetical protein